MNHSGWEFIDWFLCVLFCFSPVFAPRLSWVLLYMSLIFVMSILMAVIATASSLFPQSSAFVIFLLFFLYGISSVSIPHLVQFSHPISVCLSVCLFFSHPILFFSAKTNVASAGDGCQTCPCPLPQLRFALGCCSSPNHHYDKYLVLLKRLSL